MIRRNARSCSRRCWTIPTPRCGGWPRPACKARPTSIWPSWKSCARRSPRRTRTSRTGRCRSSASRILNRSCRILPTLVERLDTEEQHLLQQLQLALMRFGPLAIPALEAGEQSENRRVRQRSQDTPATDPLSGAARGGRGLEAETGDRARPRSFLPQQAATIVAQHPAAGPEPGVAPGSHWGAGRLWGSRTFARGRRGDSGDDGRLFDRRHVGQPRRSAEGAAIDAFLKLDRGDRRAAGDRGAQERERPTGGCSRR